MQCSAMSTASFGAFFCSLLCLDQARLLTLSVHISWRVAFMEKCIEELDFENVDQMVQIHGTCEHSSPSPLIHR